MKFPDHPPRFEKMGKTNEGDAAEVSLTYDETMEYLRMNGLPETDDGLARFYVEWYSHFRKQGYRDEYAEHQFRFAWDSN